MINGTTKTLGLIGNPVAHTLSPLIHNTIIGMTKQNLVYVPFWVKQNLPEAVKGAYELGVHGLNVTVPYKTQVMDCICEVDEKASLIGAVNTLVRTENGYKGYNTDYKGLSLALQNEGVQLRDGKVILVGAGGAARAVAFLCAWEGAEEIIIINRTLENGLKLKKEIIDKTGYDRIKVLTNMEVGQLEEEGYIAIQATNVGLAPDVLDSPITEEAFFDRLSVVYDLIYNPCETMFMKLAKEHGVRAYNGLSMLLYQGVASYELWSDTQVEQSVITQIYDLLKKEFE